MNTIKLFFEAIGVWFKKIFSSLWNWIKEFFFKTWNWIRNNKFDFVCSLVIIAMLVYILYLII